MRMMTAKRIIILLFPLLITPLIGFLIADGYLNFGAGEKDLFLLIPWCLWSLFFIISGSLLWRSKIPFRTWILKSLIYSVLTLLFLWLCLLIYSVMTTT